MFNTTPPKLRPGKKLCMYMINGDMPCPRRGDYLLVFNGEAGIAHGKARSCHMHMAGLMLCWQYGGHELPAFHTRVVN